MLDHCPPATRLRFAIPSLTGHVTADTSHSINEAALLLAKAGVEVSFDYVCGCCYLDHTRNMLATRFMASDATDMLFVDADVGFSTEAALTIARVERPFVAGIYRKKNDKPEWPVTFEQETLQAESNGLLEAATVPTGFMRLNRAVFEAMPAETYRDQSGDEFRAWFGSGSRGGLYWGEDTQFCLDWRRLGGRIYILPELVFAHNGLKAWTGSWGAWMRENAGKEVA